MDRLLVCKMVLLYFQLGMYMCGIIVSMVTQHGTLLIYEIIISLLYCIGISREGMASCWTQVQSGV